MRVGDPSYYLSLDYKSEVTPDSYEDGRTYFVARIPDLPGCISSGSTREEAENNLRDAKRLYIAAALEHGFKPPLPSVAPAQEVTTEAWLRPRAEIVVARLKGRGGAEVVRKDPSPAGIAIGRRQSLRAKVAG